MGNRFFGAETPPSGFVILVAGRQPGDPAAAFSMPRRLGSIPPVLQGKGLLYERAAAYTRI